MSIVYYMVINKEVWYFFLVEGERWNARHVTSVREENFDFLKLAR